ncbi:hypothetical protein ACFYOD_37765 [Streptomyces sp. NPDC006703]|uniref:hypothetical protein n=1 Tax=Streptomyces sp. NPDC006703 TaxID=3364759 RepID=UPI00368FA513
MNRSETWQERKYQLGDREKQRPVKMREEWELAGTRAWNQCPYGGHTDQEPTRLIAAGAVEAGREDEAAAAAGESERALLQEIAEAKAAGTSLGQIEIAPLYVLLDQADKYPAPVSSRLGSSRPPRSPRGPTNTFGSSRSPTARAASRCAWRTPPTRNTTS